MTYKFNPIKGVKSWFAGVLPLVYDESLSYYEQIAKFTDKLNEVIKNTNDMGESLASIIGGGKDYYINVTNPGGTFKALVGDGNTDNTEAFQELAKLENAVLFFPAGVYATKSVTCKCDIVGAGAFDTQILCLNDNSTNAGIIMTENSNIYNIGINGNRGGQSENKSALELRDGGMGFGIRCYNAITAINITGNNCEFMGQVERSSATAILTGNSNIVVMSEDNDGVKNTGSNNIVITNFKMLLEPSTFNLKTLTSKIESTGATTINGNTVGIESTGATTINGNTVGIESTGATTINGDTVGIESTGSIKLKGDIVNIESNRYIVTDGTITNNLIDNGIYYNVKSFGAVGDGVTDDTISIQKACDYAMLNGGGVVSFPAGTYIVTSSIIIRPHTASDKIESSQEIHFLKMDRLKISGYGNATIKASGEKVDFIFKTNDFSYPDNVGSYSNFYTVIENIHLNGNNVANGIYLYNALHCIVNNVQINNVVTGIYINGYGEATISDCVIKGTKCIETTHDGDDYIVGCDFYPTEYGIKTVGYGGSSRIIGNTFTQPVSDATPVGIRMEAEENTTNGPYVIFGNSFDGVKVGVEAAGAINNTIADVNVMANKLSGSGINNMLCNFIFADNCRISNNNIPVKESYDTVGKLCELTYCNNVMVNNNIVNTNDTSILLYGSKNCRITGNAFIDCKKDYIVASELCSGTLLDNNEFHYNNHVALYSNNGVGKLAFINNVFIGYDSNTKVTNHDSNAIINTESFVTSV